MTWFEFVVVGSNGSRETQSPETRTVIVPPGAPLAPALALGFDTDGAGALHATIAVTAMNEADIKR
jgi:hypothetical protein